MAPIEQSEVVYYALKHHSLKDAERDALREKMQEWEKSNKVYQAKPWESALNRGLNLDSHKADQQRYAIRQPEHRGGAHNQEVDITGQRFGKLTVQRRSRDRTLSGYWVCKCDCGEIDQAEKKRLLDGRKTECKKCEAKSRTKLRNKKTAAENDLHGKKFHKLTVLGVSEKRVSNKKSWDCRCDCGKVIAVVTYKLTAGERKSCGGCKNEKKA